MSYQHATFGKHNPQFREHEGKLIKEGWFNNIGWIMRIASLKNFDVFIKIWKGVLKK